MTWKTRLSLESRATPHTAFVTLTLRDDQLVYSIQARRPTLIPDDLKNWLKRFRKAINQPGMRYYAAGEYSPAERPHYHLIIFGFKGCAYGKSRYADGRTIDCCAACDLVRDTWGKGIIETQQAVPAHFGYVAGYVMKKMTSKHDVRLNGRHPEFSRQSNGGRTGKGGLGYSSVAELAQISRVGLDAGKIDDVVTHVRIDGKKSILGRYIRNKIRKELGLEEKASPAVQAQVTAELLTLCQAAKTDPINLTLKKQLVHQASNKIASIKARHEINNSRKRNRSL